MKSAILRLLALFTITSASALAIDLDGNGRSDIWDGKFGISQAADNALDTDLDGYGLLDESLLGTDPASFQSAFNYDFETNQSSQVVMTFYGRIGKVYQFESSLDRYAQAWEPLGAPVSGYGSPIMSYSSFPSQSGVPVYYRIRLLGELDADGDDLTAWEENELATSDYLKDTDGDDVEDGVEYGMQTDPTLFSDTDNDGLSDDWELLAGMDPNDDDENNNQILDGLDDWDGDDILNKDEATFGLDPGSNEKAASGNVTDFIYDSAGRATGSGSTAYTPDPEGNIVTINL